MPGPSPTSHSACPGSVLTPNDSCTPFPHLQQSAQLTFSRPHGGMVRPVQDWHSPLESGTRVLYGSVMTLLAKARDLCQPKGAFRIAPILMKLIYSILNSGLQPDHPWINHSSPTLTAEVHLTGQSYCNYEAPVLRYHVM